MNSNQIRTEFLNFFESKNHDVIKSASLIPHDNTLLFTAAGMVPLKDYFSGNKVPDNPNMASSQKCIRTIDIDIIGDTDRHLSFFEMLGNFSVGKYFKKEAIRYSYEFITEVLLIDPERLWFTVYKDDKESFDIWRDEIGVPEERIQYGDKDNFWHMNIPGPCGPCSEIFIDRGSKYGPDGGPIGGGEDRFVEIWNLVFMESIQDKPFEVVGTLPSKNIDTGMGLERIAMIMQEKESLFETDLFSSIHKELSKKIKNSNAKYEKIILDHIKASTFMLSDGVVPTNEGRGYILRRLIRRALRAYNKLTEEPSSLDFLIKEVTKLYSEPYPELDNNIEKITKLFKTEEDLFGKTLNKGIQEINTILETGELSAKQAFYLFETYGFPFELTQEIALENKITLNEEEFQQYFENHKIKSKGSSTKINQNMKLDIDTNNFCGYETIDTVSEIYHVEPLENKSIIFTKINPFYFEAGGQISDEGKIKIDEKEYFVEKVVQSENGATGLVVDINNLNIGDEVQLIVDDSFRNAVSKSHSAAHIVHSALRNILGDHVAQAGSNVAPGRFRFDFSHTQKVSDEELSTIFETANKVIFDDLEVNTNIMNIDKAKDEGALAFFGDKYDDDVRVVNIGTFSKELCGGTHVKNSHDVGLVVLTQESSIGSNLRRVEMLSGSDAYDFLNSAYKSYQEVADILKVQASDVSTKLKQNLETLEEYKLKISNFRKDELIKLTQDYSAKSSKIGKYNVIIETISLENTNESKEVASNMVNNFDVDICILFSNISGKTTIVGSTKPSVDLDISIITNDLSSLYGGGASKDPNLSIGGGPGKYDTSKAIDVAIKSITKLL